MWDKFLRKCYYSNTSKIILFDFYSSRDDKSSPENSKTANSSAGSFQNPTQPLSARIKPNSGLRGHEAGMTDSAIQRHVRLIITYNFDILYTNTRANVYGFHCFMEPLIVLPAAQYSIFNIEYAIFILL